MSYFQCFFFPRDFTWDIEWQFTGRIKWGGLLMSKVDKVEKETGSREH